MPVGDVEKFPPDPSQWELVLDYACLEPIGAAGLLADAFREAVDPARTLPPDQLRIDIYRTDGDALRIWRRVRTLRSAPD